MAKCTIVTLTDDLEAADGRDVEATDQIRFAYRGHLYDIDLCPENADAFDTAMAPYVKAARNAGPAPHRTDPQGAGTPRTRSARPTTAGGTNPARIRAWAIEHHLTVPKRGRLPKKICEAYQAAQLGDMSPLEELRKIPATDTPPRDVERAEALTSTTQHASTTTSQEPEHALPDQAADDPDEAEARSHYVDLKQAGKLSDRAAREGYWERRTAGGLERTERVDKMAFVERIQILTPRNLELLSKLAGVTAPDGPGKISYLKGSVERLENLEVIVADPESAYGWSITRFGRYALSVRQAG